MISGVVAAILGTGGIATVGISYDRPALFSEVEVVMQQATENQLEILHIQQKSVRSEIWEMEDRIEAKGISKERRDRLRNLEVELEDIKRAIELITEFEYEIN